MNFVSPCSVSHKGILKLKNIKNGEVYLKKIIKAKLNE